MAHRLIWGRDLMKGVKIPNDNSLKNPSDDVMPFQFMELEEKTVDWMKAVADYFELAGWNNVRRKAGPLYRNYQMRYGELNPSDYVINPNSVSFGEQVGWMLPQKESSPLQQFYPIAPTFVDVLRGELLKRDNRWTVTAVDPTSREEVFSNKDSQFREVIFQQAMLEKQQAMARMGLSEEVNPEQYQQALQQAATKLKEVELKSKSFRTTGVQWAEKVLKIHEKRYNLHELEPDGFESGLITDTEFWHLDLLEDDFKLELLNPLFCDHHKGPNTKYVSDGDYFLWFDFMSTGDIVNKYGRRMKEEDLLKLKDVYQRVTANLMVLDIDKGKQGSYYDRTKPYSVATELNPVLNDVKLGQELALNYSQSGNFIHNIDLTSPSSPAKKDGHPQMFRVMNLYWRSMRKVGWLTKINRDGTTIPPDWVDENFRVTVEPVYDNSVLKEKTKDNLLYGEHIDWTWAPEWRRVIKIATNQKSTFWAESKTDMDAIYIDGGPVRFQFKGINNPFDGLPPVEGCTFTYINSQANSFIDRIRGPQIIYNICMNKVPRKFLEDKGLKVAVDKRSYSTNNPGNTTTGLSAREEYESRLDDSQILEYSITREALEGMSPPAFPTVLNLSTAQEAQFYLTIADQIKWMAGESIGITRSRMGAQKASETATGIQQGINYSETQTEKYFEQHSNLMHRVRQRMLDATQYYSTFHESSKELYMNDREENVFLSIEGMENTLAHYNINLETKANTRAALQTIAQFLQNENTLPIKPSAKLEAMIDNSIPRIMNMVKQSEIEQEAAEQEKQRQEMEMREKEIQAENARFEEEQNRTDARESAKLESNEEIARIRALGGVQTDSNADGQTDAQMNLENYFRQQELTDGRRNSREANEVKRQIETDKLLVEREKARMKLEGDKYKADRSLDVARENKPPKSGSK